MRLLLSGLLAILLCTAVGSARAATTLAFPVDRDAFTTTEDVIVAVNRQADGPLAAGDLVVTLTAADGGATRMVFAAAASTEAARTEFVALNGRLLRPGAYSVAVTVDGSGAETAFSLHDLTPWSSFELVNWGARSKNEQQLENTAKYRYTLVMQNSDLNQVSWYVKAGIRQTPCCVMGGAHQMDLRTDASWADPYVLQGGRRRVSAYASGHDENPALIGIHFYDEPGLTWHKHPGTGEWTPHMIPAQVRAYEAAYGKAPIDYSEVDPSNPAHVAAWKHWATWKLSLMEAAWTDATQASNYVDNSLLTMNQSQYGWTAFTDGYYFNIQRQQPVVLGHGGYHDLSLGYWTPNLFLEAAVARDHSKPVWYLPTWYGNTTPDEYRTEQYLAFMQGIQGLMTPPPLDPTTVPAVRDAVIETNTLMGRIGPAFTTLKPAAAPVGVLYSMSHLIDNQTRDMSANYAHATKHGAALNFVFLALKSLHMPFQFVVEEDILDGSTADKRVLLLASIDHLDAPVITRLEQFIAGGGTVLLTADSTQKIAGAVALPASPDLAGAARIAEIIPALGGASKEERTALLTELRTLNSLRAHMAAADSLVPALRTTLQAAGVAPAAIVDQPGVAVNRLTDGDVEYTILVNATHDPAGENPSLAMKPVTATLAFPADGRPIYDVLAGALAQLPADKNPTATLEMGVGQIAIYARTARPIGALAVAPPKVLRDYTVTDMPVRLRVRASLLDTAGTLLAVAAPVHLRVLDPAGNARYDLYRATQDGQFAIDLPLAENDPSGQWTVEITDGLSGAIGRNAFAFAGRTVGAMAGTAERALLTEQDRERILRLARVHDSVTLVPGPAPHEQAAAERLQRTLAPWGLDVRFVSLDEALKPRELSETEAATWIGMTHTPKGSIKPGAENDPKQVGYAVTGPLVLIGEPKTHPLIALIGSQRLRNKPLYVPAAGRARITWSYEVTASRQEAILLLANDAAGMDEAAGMLYEVVAGIRPLMRFTPPTTIAPAAAN